MKYLKEKIYRIRYSRLSIFAAKFFLNPKQVGAIVPSSKFLSREMVKALNTTGRLNGEKNGSPIVKNFDLIELGPGTGEITNLIQNEKITLIEVDELFCEMLEKKFPNAKVINQSAVEFLKSISEPADIVSSIPLISNPESREIKAAISSLYSSGLINKFVTYSYGLDSPLKNCGFKNEKRFSYILLNIPPATVWLYS